MDLKKNLEMIQQRILVAQQCVHRPPGSVSLLAVSKTQAITQIAQLFALGQKDFGENYVQEALPKIQALSDKPLIWHFIGPVQSKKTKDIAQYFSWVHTVSRLKEAQHLSDARSPQLPALNLCIQVKLDNSPAKGGIFPQDVPELVGAIKNLPRLSLRGLMALPPLEEDFEQQRQYFKIVRDLFEALNQKGANLDTLSMGMTQDLEAAIAEGSTLVRVGTGLFGPRKG